MKKKVKRRIPYEKILGAVVGAILMVASLLTVVSFFLVFLNAHMEYFQELPTIMKVAIPLGLVALIIKIASIDFFKCWTE